MRAVLDRILGRDNGPHKIHWTDEEYNSNGIFEVPTLKDAVRWSKETREHFPATIVYVVSNNEVYEIDNSGKVRLIDKGK